MSVYQIEIRESGKSVKFYGQIVAQSSLSAIGQIESLLKFQPNREFIVNRIRQATANDKSEF